MGRPADRRPTPVPGSEGRVNLRYRTTPQVREALRRRRTRRNRPAVSPIVHCKMTESLRIVSTDGLRSNLSQIINLAAYGREPVIVTRRGLKVAAVVSFEDLKFLMRMQKKREELRNRPMPSGSEAVGRELAARLEEELFFDS